MVFHGAYRNVLRLPRIKQGLLHGQVYFRVSIVPQSLLLRRYADRYAARSRAATCARARAAEENLRTGPGFSSAQSASGVSRRPAETKCSGAETSSPVPAFPSLYSLLCCSTTTVLCFHLQKSRLVSEIHHSLSNVVSVEGRTNSIWVSDKSCCSSSRGQVRSCWTNLNVIVFRTVGGCNMSAYQIESSCRDLAAIHVAWYILARRMSTPPAKLQVDLPEKAVSYADTSRNCCCQEGIPQNNPKLAGAIRART